MRRALIVTALIAALVGCAKDDHPADLISFNFCGNVCAHGTNHGIAVVRNIVTKAGVRIVALQEICRSQADALRAALADTWREADLAYVTTFGTDLDGANQCPRDDYGIAIIAPRLGHHEVAPLPNPGLGKLQIDERKILCADVQRLEACTTHIVRAVNDPEAHAAQMKALRSFLENRRHHRFVLAGDINELAPIDAPGFVTGHFRLDHAYVSRVLADEVTTSTTSCRCSDHRALIISFGRT
jgi:endonuclease/exonuclease/phosphatase family metal-dependent hydrolase